MADLRRLMDPYADFAQAFSPKPRRSGATRSALWRSRASVLQANDRHRPLLTRMAGIALARLGENEAAIAGAAALAADGARPRADYDIAATIDVFAGLGAADPEMLRDRNGILAQPEGRAASDTSLP